MRASWMLALQAAVVVAVLAVRAAAAGWLFAIYLISIVGPLVTAIPMIVALVLHERRRRVSWPIVLPFVAAALTMLTAAAFIQDGGDNGAWTPIVHVFDPGIELSRATALALNTLGYQAVIAYLLALVWLTAAVTVSGRRTGPAVPMGRQAP